MNDYVILLHGLGRTSLSMLRLARFLRKQGYYVHNIGYPSRKYPIEKLAEHNLKEALEKYCTDQNKKIHFVTHSMGGIIVRYFLSKYKPKNLGRVVMLSPPNKGSEIADFFQKYKLAKFIMGDALSQLGTDKNSLPLKLALPDFEFGVIMAKQPIAKLDSLIFSGESDSIVSVESAKLANMQDFMIIPGTHSFIMYDKKVIQATARFLESGKFGD
ncbi:MAG: alpha/beta hydrolase [Candidatus Gracilibacteria bacterium]|nr:alpha/beta hydrolase [Candidatus Gracilibacteria bacterium]